MAETKLEVAAISPQTFARAPWNKYHWRITRGMPGGNVQFLLTCCAEAKKQDRTCVGFDTRSKAIAAGCVKRNGLLKDSNS